MDKAPLLSVADAAARLKISPKTLHRRVSEARNPIPFLQIGGGTIRFDADELETYIQKSTPNRKV